MRYSLNILIGVLWLLLIASMASAQAPLHSEPQPTALPPVIESPQDIAYPGTMTLTVDATDIEHRIFRIHQVIPVVAGPLVLLYPQWIAGAHSPSGPIQNFSGLKISALGTGSQRRVDWVRDSVSVYAYHVDVPSGTTTLDIEAEYLTPTEITQGGIAMTPNTLRLNWYATALYPAGYFARRIEVNASVKLPQKWQFATALDIDSTDNNTSITQFKTVSFETLIDSPLIAGKYFAKIDLDPKGRSRVTLDVMADAPEYLLVKPAIIDLHREIIRQTDKLYGARHFDHYDFLLSLSNELAGMGIEHQRSSDDGTVAKYFSAWQLALISRDLLTHEYNHSWNGKYRRPADLWTPSPQVPMRNSLLWVYEGQTQYYGNVLAARAGLLSKQQALDSLASTAANLELNTGRTWRNLQDTTNDPLLTNRRPIPWQSWQRGEDYYQEGELVWLDVDTLIRERSKNHRSLDDFARAFFGINDGDEGQLTYVFDDVVRALNQVMPYDWADFLRARLQANASVAPLQGIARGGYQLVYTEEPSDFERSADAMHQLVDLSCSLGVKIDNKGRFAAVQWEGPIFKAGLAVGAELIAIDGNAYQPEKLKAAVTAAKDTHTPLALLIREGDIYKTVNVDYHEGLRYPHLQRVKGTPALLDDILMPRK